MAVVNAFTGLGIAHPEFCTPLTEVKKGFSEEAKEAIMVHRARAVKVAGKNKRVNVSNMHYNISTNIDYYNMPSLVESIGPAYALLLFSNKGKFYRWSTREQGEYRRMEICAPALMDSKQIEAAYSFLAGTIKGVESRYRYKDLPVKLSNKLQLKTEPFESINAYVVDTSSVDDFQSSIIKKGPDAVLDTNEGPMRAREYLENYFHLFEKEIGEVATIEEMNVLKDLIEGKREFEIEKKPSHTIDDNYIKKQTGKKPLEVINDFKPTGAAELFAYSVKNPITTQEGGREIKLEKIYWDKIVYEISENNGMNYNKTVMLDEMEYFLEELEQGN